MLLKTGSKVDLAQSHNCTLIAQSHNCTYRYSHLELLAYFQALQSNPKIKLVIEDGVEKFLFKPKYEIPNRKALLNLLKRHDLHGDGGVLLEDVEESCPNAQKALKV